MAGSEQASEKLREYLRALTPEARALLMGELERSILRGEPMPQAELLIGHLREALREDELMPSRMGNPARLFFVTLEPFIIDDAPEFPHEARLPRACIGPLWDWITTEVAPDEAKTYVTQVSKALLGKEGGKAEQVARAFQDTVVRKLDETLENIHRDDKARRRIAFRLGTASAQTDVGEFATILKARDALAAIGARLPSRIRTLSGDQLDQIIDVLAGVLARQGDLFRYAMVMVMNRMPAPWQLVQVAIRSARSDQSDRIAETPYGVAVTMVLSDIERVVRTLVRDFQRGQMVRAINSLTELHEAVRGVRSEINMVSGTASARQLASIRADVANALRSDLETIPGRVRRIIRIVPGKQLARGATIDESEVSEIEGLLAFLSACKACAGELALNEITLRVVSDLQSQLDNGSRAILDVLRGCPPADLPYRRTQMDAATRFCAKVMGDEYATLLARAADVAVSTERKAKA